MGTGGGGFVLRTAGPRGPAAWRRKLPGGFHSLRYGLNKVSTSYCGSAAQLRGELMQFIQANAHLEIAGDTLEEWVRWDSNTSVGAYTKRMAKGGWGGGIEMAACALLKKVNVHVYERRFLGGYRRISRRVLLRLPRAELQQHPRALPGRVPCTTMPLCRAELGGS
ncbi:unnamed protein product [Prorocentrum cordatum]|uniref:Poly(ADP-ribose) glycohydrolase n=1 Tax=Prorocentrum cordatum TaxID=2364126 RepID=A0ABN9XTP7_9DINO|nr:unnamed protein product [Polarella glacialis]